MKLVCLNVWNKSKQNFTYFLRYNVIRDLAVPESVQIIIVLPLG